MPEAGLGTIPDGDPSGGGTAPSHRPTDELRQLIRDVRSGDVVVLADRIVSTSADPYEVARAYLMKLGALINLGRTAECPPVVDRADEALREHQHPALLGEFHALAGFVAHAEGSLDRGVMHLVHSQRVLESIETHDITSADAWNDLASVYSYLGFHDHARSAVSRAHRAAQAAGLHPAEHAAPDVGVRAAVSLDHRGDTERCRDQLVELLADLQHLLAGAGGLSALRPDHLPYVEYAVARLAALGHADAVLPLPRPGNLQRIGLPEAIDLRGLSGVCRAIADDRAGEALHKLARLTVDPRTVGGAEVHRLRAIAHAAAGEHAAADAADRTAFRIASVDLERVRALFVDGIAVRLDHEDLRRTVGRYAGEALHKLARLTVDPRTVGGAEVHRLRAIAHAAAGEHAAADAADRTAFRIASVDLERVRALFVDGIAVRLDHEDLRRTVGRYAGEALSDPLTGLANRRSLEQRIEQMTRDREPGVLGVIDLDAFKAVNTVHGHLTGDLVLQRVATVLIRTLRRRDFVARYGGDEFVLILPSTTLAEADMIGRRLTAAVHAEDWESLVPGTPVSASIGWAELHESTGLVTAFRKADRAMLDAKGRPPRS